MKPSSLAIILLLFITEIGISQTTDFFVPINIEADYDKGIRDKSGKSGKNYWQNDVVYSMSVEIIPETDYLKGSAEIRYFNNSPDTLSIMVLKLWQDLYKKGNTRLRNVLSDDLTKGIILNNIKINGNSIKRELLNRDNTILKIELIDALIPNSFLDLAFTWNMQISKTNLRMGQYDSTSYFLGYWYPRIAVYDSIDGWDDNPETGAHEVYNEFGDYNVSISVPEGFIVWATGNLNNAEEVLSSDLYYRYNQSLRAKGISHIIHKDDIGNKEFSNQGNNTWHFEATGVNDFAFGISDHYLWDMIYVPLNNGNKRVQLQLAYHKESEDFSDIVDILKDYLLFLDEKFQNVSYPYSNFTVFNGYKNRGQEYPMMANNGSMKGRFMITMLNAHELAHSYLPFTVGFSGNKYVWINEGLTSLFTLDFLKHRQLDYLSKISTNVYEKFAGTEWDLPLVTPSYLLSGESLSIPAYYKSMLMFEYFKNMIGDEEFYSILELFLIEWKGKHPTPYDLLNFFNFRLNENFMWFWKPWIFEPGVPDLAIDKIIKNDDIVTIRIIKLGSLPVPVHLNINFADGLNKEIKKDVSIWKSGKSEFLINHDLNNDVKIKSIELNTTAIPDVNRLNNIIKIEDY